ncbi:MAG: hypothetical protein E4H01_10945 [Lysobacterales bacterium]|nr:MAG: hypothetical protein E4H01_10945 [Xanthomonadales bacterium]
MSRLFDRPAVRNDDPQPSHDAYAYVLPKIPERYSKLVTVAASFGARGATAVELADAMELPRDSVSPRLKELERKGLLIRSDRRRVPSGFKVPQTVWVHPEYCHEP